ncbi:MAG TPA: hypothetical protein VLV18_01265 [Terriglobales bacterium]|nr:hypothetical protein [Terriglobales bacterium]
MNLRAVYELASVITKSQIRGMQRGRIFQRIFSNPRIILAVDFAILLGLGAAGYRILQSDTSSQLLGMIGPIVPQALTGVPSAIMFMMIVFGVLYEISQPIQSLSTDLVNWLPISPLDYVGGSALSEVYLYSFTLCLLLGVLLGPSIYLGLESLWLATAFMAIVALFIGACVVEILDSITNRISSTFYKKSGRSAIILRLASVVVLLALVQLFFSGYMINYLLQSLIHITTVAWFVPIVWPSLAVLSLTEAGFFDYIAFSGLSLLFAACLLVLAAQVRERFWVPVPVSITLSKQTYRPGRSSLPFVGAVESAVMLKDFRSLTRRREMARFLAVPFVIAISIALPIFQTASDSGPSLVAALSFYLFPLSIFASMLSMVSIGQEGYAIWNLYAAPIKASQLLRAKLFFVAALGLVFGFALLAFLGILMPRIWTYFWAPLVLGIALVFEEAARGVYVAARSPDFRDMIRTRYVGVWAQLGGISLSLLAVGLAAGPTWLYEYFFGTFNPVTVFASFVALCLVFSLEWLLARRQVGKLMANIRV